MFDHINEKSVYFIGIGGIGMSSLARWFKAQNWAVSGSDMVESKITQDLRKDGVKVKIGHKKANLESQIGLVIYNNAIPVGNPELLEARKRGLPVYSYPEAVGELTKGYETFAVAGAHGKSTTTSLLSLVLLKGGFDPTVIVGTRLKEFDDTNFRLGSKDYLVLEADEWKAAFLNYSPTFIILTNIDKEHLDFYKSFENVERTFLKFIDGMKLGGTLVVNKDNENLWKIRKEIERLAKQKAANVIWYSLADRPDLKTKLKRTLSIPGEHNLTNALAVLMLAKSLGIEEKMILTALHGYKGAWRRFEYRGNLNVKRMKIGSTKWRTKAKIPVYDDYAHHPTEINATLAAFREKFPKHKIICVFEPHQAKRLQNLFKEFTVAFDKADYLVLMPTYKVAGRDKINKAYTSENLAKKIERLNKNLNVAFCGTYKKLPKVLGEIITPLPSSRFVIVMMGAGTIANHTDELI
ncbi:UDP-N-acetylmuramate--L-alanine ligase [Patescibacteria group bacterium]|nr:UDP-N-acetylmuramate--L-alanine ligase [Patescibacteria group bacterium]